MHQRHIDHGTASLATSCHQITATLVVQEIVVLHHRRIAISKTLLCGESGISEEILR